MAGANPNPKDDDDHIDDDDEGVVVELDEDDDDGEDSQDDGEDDSGSDDEGDEGQDGDDQGTGDDGDDEEAQREAIRERRRQERKDKKEHQRQQAEQTRRELAALRRERDEMRQRLDLIERKTTGSEMAQLDHAISETDRAAAYFKEQIRVATEANDGATLAEATDRFYQVQRQAENLQRIKQAAVQQTTTREQRSPIDPTLRRHAESWMSKNTWYDPSGGDPDSRVALTIDNAMGEEGWDPRTPEYWEELSARLGKYLPHRMRQASRPQTTTAQQRNPARRSPTGGSGRDTSSGSPGTVQFKLSPERVAALKEAGVWEDKEARDKMIKKYRDFDKENAKK